MWAFCYCKQKQLTKEIAAERVAGDVWLWSAIDAETKLAPCWYVGQVTPPRYVVYRGFGIAPWRIEFRSHRTALKLYVNAVIDAFADEVDYAQLVKYYI